jgi:hypothetical protein
LKLACLKLNKKRTPYAIAQQARNLHARIEEIQRSLQCPCPSRYGLKQLKSDDERLNILADRRAQRNLFPPEEDLEEARRTARFDSFRKGPEVSARQRLANLRDKKRVADNGGPPLTAAQETLFRFLTLLYPSPPRPSPRMKKPREPGEALGQVFLRTGSRSFGNRFYRRLSPGGTSFARATIIVDTGSTPSIRQSVSPTAASDRRLSPGMIEQHPFSTEWPYPYIVGNPNYPEPES